ncbi:response regulator transcription factor [Paenibacillus sp. GXUN7292]|uniref:response regulator transcription factor n=1 Tax=Paenibacillus sp. GXUN7292 TaxID=3422499 RepID=UPI003D7EA96A
MFNVLLVDDEPIVKIALRTMIDWDKLGFPICGTASDGMEALALIEQLKPDIIITDLKMPNMDGLQLMRELNERQYKGKVIVASNFGEFELVREALLLGAIDYMLKISIKTEDLISQLHKAGKLLQEQQHTLQEQVTREQFIQSNLKSFKSSVLKDYFTNADFDIAHLLQNDKIQLNLISCPSFLFYITFDLADSKQQSNNNISISFIENMLLDLADSENEIETFQTNINSIVAMVSLEQLKNYQSEPLVFVQRIQKLILMYTTVEPVIAYSNEFTGYEEAKLAYQACKEAITIHFYNHNVIISSKEIALKHDIAFTNYVDYSAVIIDRMTENDPTVFKTELKALTDNCKQNNIHPLTLKNFIIKCLDYIPLSSNRVYIRDPEQFELSKKNILHSKDSQAFLNYAVHAFECLFLTEKTAEVTVYKKEIVDVINYIEERYKDKLTLETIANYVNFSENHLCRVFKEQVGTSLINYINHVRMGRAADLIMQGYTYMKEVASLVGISDQFYFSRLFKKHFGVSPTEYKAQQLQLRKNV